MHFRYNKIIILSEQKRLRKIPLNYSSERRLVTERTQAAKQIEKVNC